MNVKKTLLAVSILASSILIIPSASLAEQDKPGVLSPESQKYFNEIVAANKKSWLEQPHKHAASGHLITTICVEVDAEGTVKRSVYESSGDKSYDEIALNICKGTALPKPPDTWNPGTKVGVIFSSRVKTQNTPNKYRDTN